MGRRRHDSTGGAGWALGLVGCIVLGIIIGGVKFYLRQERRNRDNDQFDVDRGGGGFHNPNPQPFNPGPQPHVPPQNQPPKPPPPGLTETEAVGGFGSIDYREYRNDGAILIGFQIGLGAVTDTAVVSYLRPIWLTAKGEELGKAYGRTKNQIVTVKARDGYAIGGIRIKSGGAIEGLCFTFMRRGEKHLIKDDYYISDWYGEQTRMPPKEDLRRGNGDKDGGFVIGIHGKRFDDKGGSEFHDSGSIGTIGLSLWVRE